jgi:hypothetical protein
MLSAKFGSIWSSLCLSLSTLYIDLHQIYELYVYVFFSSPDPKGHVRYCHHLASVVRRPSVNFSYFNLLL